MSLFILYSILVYSIKFKQNRTLILASYALTHVYIYIQKPLSPSKILSRIPSSKPDYYSTENGLTMGKKVNLMHTNNGY